MSIFRVCADTVIDSGLKVLDLNPPEEMEAAEKIVRLHNAGKLKLVTTAETRREQERTLDLATRAIFVGDDRLSVVQPTHEVIGFGHVIASNNLGMIANPIVTDIVNEDAYLRLRAIGLAEGDAKHIMYAINSKCDVFVTLDTRDIIPYTAEIEAACTIRIMKPTELIAALSGT